MTTLRFKSSARNAGLVNGGIVDSTSLLSQVCASIPTHWLKGAFG
jgi:hypothetical protein